MVELVVKDLVAGYGNVSVLHKVSLDIADGETVALLGTNGNGKSTLMWCIAGLLKPTSGSIWLRLTTERFLIGPDTVRNASMRNTTS